jgi:RimJ/RimL family protein N-acetyltransferase
MAAEHLDASVATLYDLEAPVAMLRMVVDRLTFRPFAGPAERLTALDIDDLNRLYQLGFRAGFPASVVEDGIYYGVRVRGRLVSAAGTHAINEREGIAVVGNVLTHTDYRGHDYAKMVTSAVTADLLASVTDVALNVHASNAPAVAAYARLGYRIHCRLTERLIRRRQGGWGLMRPIREAMRFGWPREQR